MKKILGWFSAPYDAKSGHVAGADLLRVFSVFLVTWFHIWQQSWLHPGLRIGPVFINLEPLVRAGYMGVDLLLALSGFLLFLPYARARVEGTPLPKLKTYYLRRVARIVPSYYACVLFMLFFSALPRNEYGGSTRYMLMDLLPHLTFTHSLFYESYLGTHLGPALWTLSIEVQFYLIAPFIGRAFIKKPLLTYIPMVAIAFAYRHLYVFPKESYALYFNQLPGMLDVYANGMMGAYLYVLLCKKMKKAGWKALLMEIVAIGCFIGVTKVIAAQSRIYGYPDLQGGQMIHRFPLTALCVLALAAGGHGLSFLARLKECALIRWLSSISYNVYIWHFFLMLRLKEWRIPPYVSELPNQASEQPWQLHYTLMCMGGALAMGALMTYLVEKPMARLIAPRRDPGKS